jgi:hypothetical protein
MGGTGINKTSSRKLGLYIYGELYESSPTHHLRIFVQKYSYKQTDHIPIYCVESFESNIYLKRDSKHLKFKINI